MQRLTSLAAALLFAGIASSAAAQRGVSSAPATAQTREVAVDRWLTKPTVIALTPDQRTKVDSVRARFVAELSKIEADKSLNQMALVMKMRDVTDRYQKLVRQELTPAQQAAFDRNNEADVIRR
jgi:hypothetical protein